MATTGNTLATANHACFYLLAALLALQCSPGAMSEEAPRQDSIAPLYLSCEKNGRSGGLDFLIVDKPTSVSKAQTFCAAAEGGMHLPSLSHNVECLRKFLSGLRSGQTGTANGAPTYWLTGCDASHAACAAAKVQATGAEFNLETEKQASVTVCVNCPDKTYWNGQRCACESGLKLNTTTGACECQLRDTYNYDSQTCGCSKVQQSWSGCRCPQGLAAGPVKGMCHCGNFELFSVNRCQPLPEEKCDFFRLRLLMGPTEVRDMPAYLYSRHYCSTLGMTLPRVTRKAFGSCKRRLLHAWQTKLGERKLTFYGADDKLITSRDGHLGIDSITPSTPWPMQTLCEVLCNADQTWDSASKACKCKLPGYALTNGNCTAIPTTAAPTTAPTTTPTTTQTTTPTTTQTTTPTTTPAATAAPTTTPAATAAPTTTALPTTTPVTTTTTTPVRSTSATATTTSATEGAAAATAAPAVPETTRSEQQTTAIRSRQESSDPSTAGGGLFFGA
eukprot:scpid75208/ scgid0643/ 